MSKKISGIKVIVGFSAATIICFSAMASKANTQAQEEKQTIQHNSVIDSLKSLGDKAISNDRASLESGVIHVGLDAGQKQTIIENELEAIYTKYAYIKKLQQSASLRDSLAFRESSNNPQAVNQFGYVGMFQLGKIAFKDIGRTTREHTHIRKHLPITLAVYPIKEQIEDVEKLISNNKRYLRSVNAFVGRRINGVKITQNGMLAGAHLCGHVAVKKYIKSGGRTDMKDGNGVKVSSYIKMFAEERLS